MTFLDPNCKHPKIELKDDQVISDRCPDCGMSLFHPGNFVKVAEKVAGILEPKHTTHDEVQNAVAGE